MVYSVVDLDDVSNGFGDLNFNVYKLDKVEKSWEISWVEVFLI